MLDLGLKILVDDLNSYLKALYNSNENDPDLAVLCNAADKDFGAEGTDKDGQIFVHLINVEADNIYRNQPDYPAKDTPVRPATLNLYVLFAFRSKSYLQSLKLLAEVIRYYQGKPLLKDGNTTITDTTIDPDLKFDFMVNYHNISLEDSNNMWSNLGGKQQPFAIYQLRMLKISPKNSIPETTIKEAILSQVKPITSANPSVI